jgi:catechol 2,3-dioxygenase-like lactoylglutathione lyase family enzyme
MPKPAYDLQLHRSNILVADMERALSLYRDILGFKVDFLMDALDVAAEMFGLPAEAQARMAFLSEGKGAFGSLAITEAKGIDIPARGAPYPFCVIIEVREGRLAGILEQLRAQGLQVGTAYELTQPDRTDVTITDFDGHRVVLFELHPKNKRSRS